MYMSDECDYVITTDSAVDLTPDTLRRLDIHRPILISCNFKNGEPVDPDNLEKFYSELSLKNMATTAAVGEILYVDAFEYFLKQGKKVIHVGLTAGLTSSHDSAVSAQQTLSVSYPGCIAVIDALCVSGGQGLLLREMANLRLNGASFEEVVAYVEAERANPSIIHDFAIVGGLDYLAKGGRFPQIAGFVGNLMKLRPILYIDAKDGKIQQAGTARGNNRTFSAMVEKLAHNLGPKREVYIYYGNNPKDAEYCAELIRNHKLLADVQIFYGPDYLIGHTISAHVGPGVVAFFYKGNHRGPLPEIAA